VIPKHLDPSLFSIRLYEISFPDWNHLSDEAVRVSKVAAWLRSYDCVDEHLQFSERD